WRAALRPARAGPPLLPRRAAPLRRPRPLARREGNADPRPALRLRALDGRQRDPPGLRGLALPPLAGGRLFARSLSARLISFGTWPPATSSCTSAARGTSGCTHTRARSL